MTVPTMQLKRRSTVGAPATLAFGELALGDGDGLLYAGRNSGSVVALAGLPSAYAAQCVSTAALPANTYVNGTAGVGATLTATANAALSIDGQSPAVGAYVLVAGEATGANNGLYTVTQAGDGTHPYILTRASRMNTTDQFVGSDVWVTSGSAYASTLWYCTNPTAPTVGTTMLVFQCQNTTMTANWKTGVSCATTAALATNTYANGAAGAGATLTATGNGAMANVDGVTPTVGMRILVKNEAAQANNGIYTVTQVGDGTHPYILTRSTDFDFPAAPISAYIPVEPGGTTLGNTLWAGQNLSAITYGTTAVTFAQATGPGAYTAGSGITITGMSIGLTAPVTVPLGGTGLTTATTPNGVLCAGTTATGAFQNAGAGTTGQALVSGGAGAAPSFGTLGVNGGGTGLTSATTYTPICGGTSGTGALQSVASAGSSGQPLLSGGASALPSYGTLGVAGGGTGLASTTANGVLCGGTTTTAALQNAGAGTAGQLLMSNGSGSIPSFANLDMGTY